MFQRQWQTPKGGLQQNTFDGIMDTGGRDREALKEEVFRSLTRVIPMPNACPCEWGAERMSENRQKESRVQQERELRDYRPNLKCSTFQPCLKSGQETRTHGMVPRLATFPGLSPVPGAS
jgi:hypothetical protein